jgi:ABC-type histidine transport system ATPase subunit
LLGEGAKKASWHLQLIGTARHQQRKGLARALAQAAGELVRIYSRFFHLGTSALSGDIVGEVFRLGVIPGDANTCECTVMLITIGNGLYANRNSLR